MLAYYYNMLLLWEKAIAEEVSSLPCFVLVTVIYPTFTIFAKFT